MEEKVTAIVLAAGKGSRMHSDIPKQYLCVHGKEILYYSLNAFEQCKDVDEIVLVTGDIDFCRENIVEKYGLRKVRRIVPGGKERSDSVYEGLKACPDADYVMIHDGARPMIDEALLQRSLTAVRRYQACIAAMPVKDTIKIVDQSGEVTQTPDRALLWQVQTPQSFAYPLIKAAYEEMYRKQLSAVTDDAMVLERTSAHPIHVVEGSYCNQKVTTPEDLQLAEIFLK